MSWPLRAAGSCRGPNGQGFAFSRVVAEGEMPAGEVRTMMARAGIFVSPSLYEPFGLAVLEAAETGTALVLADIATYRELWDGAARFADPRDPAAFARELATLVADPAARGRLGAAARARAASFTPARQADAMLSAYRAAAGAGARLEAAE